MKAKDVQIGQTYGVKVSGTVVPVAIMAAHYLGGWTGISTVTHRTIRIKRASRLRPMPPARSIEEVNARQGREQEALLGPIDDHPIDGWAY